uniref:Uncharacterized protein n=1 Tax=Acrobeloides nanus TaxID=290746 RepID=A0A914EFP5_9BILA
MRRLDLESKENEKKRRLAEQEEIKKKIKMEQIKKIQLNPIYQAIVKEKGEEIFETLDPEMVIREQRQRLDKERREQQARQLQQEQKSDHFIRALYLEEMKEYRKISEERRAKAPIIHQEYEERRVDKANQEHQKSLLTYERITKAKEDAENFLKDVIESHHDEFVQTMSEWKNRLEQVRADRLFELRVQRAKERRRIFEEQKREEERQKQQKEFEQKAAAQQQRPQQDRQTPFTRDERRMDDRKGPPAPAPDSKADEDINWRSGGASSLPQPPVQHPPRFIERPAQQQPSREEPTPFTRKPVQPPPVETKADEDFDWRKGAAPTQPTPAKH